MSCGRGVFSSLAVFPWLLLVLLPAVAQDSKSAQRTFSVPKDKVEQVLRQTPGSSGGKLPTLDGFANTVEHAAQYNQGHYQYDVVITAVNAHETSVKVTAKITAWHAAEAADQSGYELLPSNGRLESDLLDRLGDALKVSGRSPGDAVNARATTPLKPGLPDAPSAAKENYLTHYAHDHGAAAEKPTSKEVASEQKVAQLTREMKTLQEIKEHQVQPNDLAVVLASKTPVYSRPAKDSEVVLLADADDELQVLDTSDGWVHVHLMGVSRGWVERSLLDLSNVSLPNSTKPQAAATAKVQPFQKTREEKGVFPGDWKELQGKTVDIVWVQENDGAAPKSESSELHFLESILRKQYESMTAQHNEVDGVVLVLDSANGGMIASTNSALQRWTTGSLSNDSFWRECWFDPPDIFQSLRQSK